MSFVEVALAFDAQQRPLETAWAYEIAIKEPGAELEIFLNLAVLYFVCRDFGYASYHHLSDEFVSNAWLRAFEILTLAETRFGLQTDILFWREYFSYIYSDNQQFEKILHELVLRDDSLTPFVCKEMMADENEKEHEENRKKLFDSVSDGTTERKRYTRSVLE